MRLLKPDNADAWEFYEAVHTSMNVDSELGGAVSLDVRPCEVEIKEEFATLEAEAMAEARAREKMQPVNRARTVTEFLGQSSKVGSAAAPSTRDANISDHRARTGMSLLPLLDDQRCHGTGALLAEASSIRALYDSIGIL